MANAFQSDFVQRNAFQTAVHYIRTYTALLGLNTTASRTLALTRVKTALLGLKGVGQAARVSTIKTGCTEYSTGINTQRKLVRTSDGVLHAIYYRHDGTYWQIYHAYSSDEGVSWAEEAVTSESYDQIYPSVVVDSDDCLHVVWHGKHSGSTTNWQIRYIKYDGSWGSITNLTSGSYDQLYPSMAIDSNNYLHVVWEGKHSGSTTTYQIRYIKYTTSWQAIENLTSDANDQYHPCIAIDSSNYLHVVWWESGDGDGQTYYRKYDGSWGSIQDISSTPGKTQVYPCIAVDSNDYLHVVWDGRSASDSYEQIRYRKYTDSWQTVETLTSEDYSQYEPSIAIDDNDYIHIVWFGEGADGYYYPIKHIAHTGSWGDIEILFSVDSDQYYPNLIWYKHPSQTGTPKRGYAFIWTDDTTVKYYAKIETVWIAWYNRVGTALLGLKASGTRTLALGRSNTALLGLKGTGSRTIAITRSKTALLGLKATGIMSTVGHYVRTGVAYLGLKATGTRTLALGRANTALLGLKTTGSRVLAFTRAETALLGLKATATRTISLSRVQSALLGLKTTGTRAISLSRVGTALLGLKATGTAIVPTIKLVVRVITSQYRNIAVVTSQHRLIKVITGQYRKIRTILGG